LNENARQNAPGGPANLVGRWRKVFQDPAAAPYPDEIEFTDRGIYFGRKGETGQQFTIWDAGSYRLSAPQEATLSTATDEEIRYPFSLVGDELIFRDPEGREIRYRRAGASSSP
jgi:hypothetical protein